MARLGGIAHRAEALLGTAVVATTPVAGGDICTATRLRLSNGTSALIKTRPHAPDDFFRTEAAGLRWLAEAGGVGVPEVLAVEDDCLVIAWVEGARPSVDAAEGLGRALAATHAAGAPGFGTAAGTDGYIGTLPLPNRPAPTWPEFFATRRVLPYLKLAARPRRHLVDRRRRRRAGGPPDRRPRRARRAAGPAARRPVVGQPRLGPRRTGLG